MVDLIPIFWHISEWNSFKDVKNYRAGLVFIYKHKYINSSQAVITMSYLDVLVNCQSYARFLQSFSTLKLLKAHAHLHMLLIAMPSIHSFYLNKMVCVIMKNDSPQIYTSVFSLCCTEGDSESAVRNLKGKPYVDEADGASDHGRLLLWDALLRLVQVSGLDSEVWLLAGTADWTILARSGLAFAHVFQSCQFKHSSTGVAWLWRTGGQTLLHIEVILLWLHRSAANMWGCHGNQNTACKLWLGYIYFCCAKLFYFILMTRTVIYIYSAVGLIQTGQDKMYNDRIKSMMSEDQGLRVK